jgi:hypothetical protein
MSSYGWKEDIAEALDIPLLSGKLHFLKKGQSGRTTEMSDAQSGESYCEKASFSSGPGWFALNILFVSSTRVHAQPFGASR